MFELMAVSHNGLTLDKIAEVPVKEVRQPLLQWLDTGARGPLRLTSSPDPDTLRRIQESLAFHGVRTQIRRAGRDISSAFLAVATPNPPPPVTDDAKQSRPDPVSRDSGLIEYRQMMDQMERDRSSTSHVIAVNVGRIRAPHIALIGLLALIGVLVSLAARGSL